MVLNCLETVCAMRLIISILVYTVLSATNEVFRHIAYIVEDINYFVLPIVVRFNLSDIKFLVYAKGFEESIA